MRSTRTKLTAAAVFVVGIMLPVSYGTVKTIWKHFTISESRVSFEYPEPNGAARHVVARVVGVATNDDVTEEQARARLEEFRQLYSAGKAVEVQPGIWKATLADGTEVAYGGSDRSLAGIEDEFTPEEQGQLKGQADEIYELRKAGKGERTFLREVEDHGVRVRLYSVRYTLSNGEVVTVCESEGVSGQ